MFPLLHKQLIRGVKEHIAAGLGAGADYVAVYVPFYIPFDGVISTYYGKEGGNWLRLTRPNGDKIELAHLSKYNTTQGNAKAGQLGGITGNTGAITTNPHLHIQIINKDGIRLDPERYDWGKAIMPYYIERPSKVDPTKVEVGIAIDQNEQTTILWATDPAWGDQLSKHYNPQGVFKIQPK